jgi:HlyD family secretion protein
MAQAKAAWVQSQRSFERSAEIKKTNPQLVSDEQLEQLRTQAEVNEALYQAAQHEVEQSEAAMRDARQALGKTTIVAPMSGRVTRLNVEQGETAIMGTLNKDAATLLTIADMTILETKVKVDETDVARISIGDSAVVEIDAFPDTTFVGRVTEISNSSVKGRPQPTPIISCCRLSSKRVACTETLHGSVKYQRAPSPSTAPRSRDLASGNARLVSIRAR